MLFRNELKEDTTAAIKMIVEGDVRPVMVTGDNAQCGFYIAKACGIVAPGTEIYLSELDKTSNEVYWVSLSNKTAERLRTKEVIDLCSSRKGSEQPVELAMTGKAMTIFTQRGQCKDLLLITRIFARVQPDQKVQVIEMYIDMGFITGMCGDGGSPGPRAINQSFQMNCNSSHFCNKPCHRTYDLADISAQSMLAWMTDLLHADPRWQ